MGSDECIFNHNYLERMSGQLGEPKAIFRVAIKLGLNFLAIKTLEEFFLCSDKVTVVAYQAFAAFVDTRGQCSDQDILKEICERLSEYKETEKEETSLRHFLDRYKEEIKHVSSEVHNHKIREKTFCQWELYDDPFEITNEMILYIAELCVKNNYPPEDLARELGIPDYFNIIDNKYPCHERDENDDAVDRFAWRKMIEVLFKGRENCNTNHSDFLDKLQDFNFPNYEKLKEKTCSKKYIRVGKINDKYKEVSRWKDRIMNSKKDI